MSPIIPIRIITERNVIGKYIEEGIKQRTQREENISQFATHVEEEINLINTGNAPYTSN